MVDPYVFGASAFPYEEMPLHSQTYTGLDGMTYIDPALQSPSSLPYANTWDAGLKETSTTVFFTASIPRHIRPAVGIPAAPLPSQPRFASPISLVEPSPSGSAHSPRADTESYYDLPTTPPDTGLLSPFQAPLPDPYTTAHAVQFASMGPPGYVSPFDVNPSQQQSEFSESDNNDTVDFSFQTGYSFDSHLSDESEQTPALMDLSAQPVTSPEPMQPDAVDVLGAASQYPLLPKVEEEDSTSEDEALYKREKDDDADDDYQPSKRQKTNTRTPTRRGARTKPTVAATAPSSRGRGARTVNTPATARAIPAASASISKAALTCAECNQRLPSQPELDAHTKKHHHQRPFNCVFDFAGCESTFASKNEWKRHVNTQHLLLHYWVCTEDDCAKARPSSSASASACPSPGASSTSTPGPNPPTGTIFNRKDLFTQHLKRMHVPKPLKTLLLPAHKRPSSTSTTTTKPSSSNTQSQTQPSQAHLLASWDSRLRALHQTALRPRCALPTLMRCPVPGCPASPFRGSDAWNQRMEHVAKHMERAGRGEEERVVFGGDGDGSLVEWAGRGDVGIIERRIVGSDLRKGGKGEQQQGLVGEEGGEWVLKAPLKRGPGGSVVVVAATAATTTGTVREESVEEGEEIVVEAGDGEEEEEEEEDEEDAEGEDD